MQITETTAFNSETTNLDVDVGSNEPIFSHRKAVTNIQLFFDLFIVANLSSFSEERDVNSASSLGSYIGYFCILWFTWCQVSLYDARFITDSIFERLAHAVHFGVIIALSVVGQDFNDLEDPRWDLIQTVSLIILVSRATLFFQYLIVLFFTWKFKKARMPAIVTLSTLFAVLVVHAGIYVAIGLRIYKSALVGWYIMFIFETTSSILVASRWQSFSFKGTHLVERMTILSMIILGEGVISVTRVTVTLPTYDSFTSGTIGGIICSLLIIYLVYIIYFDNVPTHHLASIRQHLWAIVHFPFHVTLVLLCEGANQFISWRRTIEYLEYAFSDLVSITSPSEIQSPKQVYEDYKATISIVLESSPFSVTYETLQEAQGNLTLLTQSNITSAGFDTAIKNIQQLLFSTVYSAYGFEPPDFAEYGDPKTVAQVFRDYYGIFDFLFGYFFICGGLTLILIATLSYISLSETGQRGKWKLVSIFINVVLGLSLCLLSLLTKSDAAFTLGKSSWTITVIVFVLLIAITVDQISKWKIILYTE